MNTTDNKSKMNDDQSELAELERDIGNAVSKPVSFEAGKLQMIDCGSGYLLVSVNDPGAGRCSELLPPQIARQFVDWVKRMAKAS